jgi:hypothetical protein
MQIADTFRAVSRVGRQWTAPVEYSEAPCAKTHKKETPPSGGSSLEAIKETHADTTGIGDGHIREASRVSKEKNVTSLAEGGLGRERPGVGQPTIASPPPRTWGRTVVSVRAGGPRSG